MESNTFLLITFFVNVIILYLLHTFTIIPCSYFFSYTVLHCDKPRLGLATKWGLAKKLRDMFEFGPNNTLEQYIIDDTVMPLVPYCLNKQAVM